MHQTSGTGRKGLMLPKSSTLNRSLVVVTVSVILGMYPRPADAGCCRFLKDVGRAIGGVIENVAEETERVGKRIGKEVERVAEDVGEEAERVGRRTGLGEVDDLGAILGVVGTAVGAVAGVAAGAACTTATLGGCAPMAIGGIVGSGVGSLLAGEPSGYVGARIGVESAPDSPGPLPDRTPSSQEQLYISRSDLSQASVDVLREITEIRNASALAQGVLLFGTIWKLVGTDPATSVVALFDAASLDTNIGAVTGVGRVAACAIKDLVAYRRLGGETGRKRWKNTKDRSYFTALYRQSAGICAGSPARAGAPFGLPQGVQRATANRVGHPVEAQGWFDFSVKADQVPAGDRDSSLDVMSTDDAQAVIRADVNDVRARSVLWDGERPVVPDGIFGLP